MRRLVLCVIVAALTAAVVVVPCTAADDAILLRFNLKPGEVYRLRTFVDQTMVMEMLGTKMNIAQSLDMGVAYAVDGVEPDGTIDFTCTYEKIKFQMAGMTYDSEVPGDSDSLAGGIFGPLLGASLKLRMSPLGRAIEWTGFDEIVEETTGTLNPEQREQFKEQIGGQLGASNVLGGLDQYPEEPVPIGGSWTTESEVGGNMPMKIRTTYTLQEIRDGVCYIDLKSDITGDSVSSSSPGLEVRVTLTGIQTGILKLDAVTGWVVGGQVTQKIIGEMEMESDGEKASEPFSVETKASYEKY